MRATKAIDKRQGRRVAIAAACALGLFDKSAWAGQFSISKTVDAAIDTAAWMANTSAPYGRAMNGNSFEDSTITTFDGYQYTAYWQNNNNVGKVAIARRLIGSSTWQTMTLSPAFRSTATSNDAHHVISLGIDPTDGTIHLAYDMHSESLRYMKSAFGLATNPTSFTWSTANAVTAFPNAEQNTMGGGGSLSTSTMTYPTFVQTPGGDLQFFIRTGISGNGSWYLYDYNGTTHSWDTGHQFDNGSTDTYTGTGVTNSPDRSNYPDGFTYGSDGILRSTFTWRETATGGANHDLNYVYSTDGGVTWQNNAGTIVANQNTGQQFHLNSPGLIVRPLPQSQTLMNQNGQAVDHHNYIHSINWYRDSSKDPSLDNPWEPQESSYFDDWRDNLGNWHEDRLPGDVGTRPKIFFDANDNAIAIYQVKSDTPGLVGGSGSNGNLYFTNGDLVISAATKASNWTDWKVIKVESGPFVSEAQGDPQLFASTGTLSIVMQKSPTLTGNQGTALRSLDYSLSFTPPTSTSFTAASGDWGTFSNWSGGSVPGTNTVVTINGGRTAQVSTSVPLLDNILAVGSGGSDGTLNITAGTLDLLQTRTDTLSGGTSGLNKASYVTNFGGSIVVGRDGGAVGSYNQTGGNVSSWRFAVGDYASETSGGGVSSAVVSGGSLTTYELDVAFSATGSSSGSSFTVAGGNVTVNGDVILGEFGNTGSITLSSGVLTVGGNLREGFNQTNTSNVRMDGGTLDMTGGFIAVDNFIYNGGTIANISTAPTGDTGLNATAQGTISGMTVGTLLVGRDASTTLTVPAGVRVAASNRIETWNGSTLSLGTGAAVAIGTTPGFTSDQVNVLAGGTLAGDGAVGAPVNNSAGVVAPGDSIGAMKLGSSFAQGVSGITEIEMGGGQTDQLDITGAATLGGTLRIKTNAGMPPLPGESYQVMTFASRSGDLTIDNQTGRAGLVFTKSYSATDLTILTSAEFNGDANLDGTVNTLDFTALASNFGETNANWLAGDFNGDGIVNALDFSILATNFGAAAPGSGGIPPARGTLVPEPAAIFFALSAFALVARRRRG
jgi:hypothetical protein